MVIEEESSTITVTTSEDVITFTIATANATLKESTPQRAVIQEDYYYWAIHDNRMHRWRHDTGATTNGMAGADYSATLVSGEWHWYPLTSDENASVLTITTQLQNSNDGTINTGSAVTDLHFPDIFDADDGLAYDGARQIDLSNNRGKLTFEQDEVEPVIVTHDWPFLSGSTPDDHLVEHFKFEDNTSSSVVVAEVGNNAAWEESDGTGRNTSNETITAPFRGDGLDTKDTYHVELDTTVYDNAFFILGSILMKFEPQFAYNDGVDQTLFSLYVDSNDYIKVLYDIGTDMYELRVSWNGTLTTISSSAFTTDNFIQKPTTIMAGWNASSNYCILVINGIVVDFDVNIGTPSVSDPSYVCIGADADGDGTTSLNADIYLDSFKTFNDCILPFGVIETQSLQRGDYDNVHSDISYYWNCSGVTAADYIGSAAPTVSGGSYETGVVGNGYRADASGEHAYIVGSGANNFSMTKGAISFWFKSVTSFNDSADHYLFGARGTGGAAQGDFYINKNSSNFIICATRDAGVSRYTYFTTIYFSVNWLNWNHYRYVWDSTAPVYAGKHIGFWVNGYPVPHGSGVGIDATWTASTSSAYYSIGNDYKATTRDCGGIIDEFYITDDPYTPEIWTAFGKPLWTPLVIEG